MTAKTNQKIRNAAKENDVALWQIAEKIGLNDGNFSRKLRHEFSPEETDRILTIINELAENKWTEMKGIDIMLEKSRENKLRRQLRKQGYILQKKVIKNNPHQSGCYRIINAYFNRIETDENYNMTLEEVERFVNEEQE